MARRRSRRVQRDAMIAAVDAVLDAIGARADAPGRCSVAQTARGLRRDGVHLSVEHDRTVDVPYLDVALGGLIESAGGKVDVRVRDACVEVRGDGDGFDPLALAIARAVARRAGGELLVCEGTRAILTLR
jgi:hypothetical protein